MLRGLPVPLTYPSTYSQYCRDVVVALNVMLYASKVRCKTIDTIYFNEYDTHREQDMMLLKLCRLDDLQTICLLTRIRETIRNPAASYQTDCERQRCDSSVSCQYHYGDGMMSHVFKQLTTPQCWSMIMGLCVSPCHLTAHDIRF